MRTLATLLIAMVCMTMAAIPARRNVKKVLTEDGRCIDVILKGDEHGHWHEDMNGRCLKDLGNGRFGIMTDRQLNDIRTERLRRSKRINELRNRRLTKQNPKRAPKRAGYTADNSTRLTTAQSAYTGKKRGVVILVNFADKSMSRTDINIVMNDMFNKPGYSENHHVGSVHDYFLDQSYGTFDLTFDIAGPVTLSRNMSYYGQNDAMGNDKHPAELVSEAVRLVDKDIDFSKYDWDNDGVVDQVYLVYAGYGEHAGASSSAIWPHEWTLASAKEFGDGDGPVTLDGKAIDTYAISCELAGTSGKTIDGIGTACHEFSHCLGFVDTYDTSYNGGAGMMAWDLMDAGSYNGYNNIGERPVQYTAYERWCAGWLTPTLLDKPCQISGMPPLSDSNAVAYIIYNDANHDEYYILENRQNGKWGLLYDDKFMGHGLLVTHIDYDEKAWMNNEVNSSAKHQRITYIPADNSFGKYNSSEGYYTISASDIQGDTYPGNSDRTELTDDTTPAATVYNKINGKTTMGKPLTNIRETGNGMIAFDFMGGIRYPENVTVEVGESGNVTVSWLAVEGAESYTLRACPRNAGDVAESQMLAEHFSKFTKSSTTAISDFDKYMETQGWTGLKVFTQVGYAKIGSSSANGYLISPLLSPKSNEVTVYFEARSYNSTHAYVAAEMYPDVDKKSISDRFMEFPEEWKAVAWALACPEPCYLKFKAGARFYIRNIEVYDGAFSLEDISAVNGKAKAVKAALSETAEDSVTLTSGNDGIITVDNIKDTSYRLSGLSAEKYVVQVRANTPTSSSMWSPYCEFSTGTPSGFVSLGKPGDVTKQRIYTILGQYVGEDLSALPDGIYIINNKKVVKRR